MRPFQPRQTDLFAPAEAARSTLPEPQRARAVSLLSELLLAVLEDEPAERPMQEASDE